MKKKVETGKGSGAKRIAESLKNFRQVGSAPYSNIIEFALTENVKDHLRENARKGVDIGSRSGAILLDNAIAEVRLELEQEHGTALDATRYFVRIKKKLSYPSKIMGERAKDYETQKDEITHVVPRQLTSGMDVEVVHIGFNDAVEGLFLNPCSPWEDLRIEHLDDKYEVRGDYFPFEIWVDSVNYVLDDDGTILVSTELLSQEQVPYIEQQLFELAERLYSR